MLNKHRRLIRIAYKYTAMEYLGRTVNNNTSEMQNSTHLATAHLGQLSLVSLFFEHVHAKVGALVNVAVGNQHAVRILA